MSKQQLFSILLGVFLLLWLYGLAGIFLTQAFNPALICVDTHLQSRDEIVWWLYELIPKREQLSKIWNTIHRPDRIRWNDRPLYDTSSPTWFVALVKWWYVDQHRDDLTAVQRPEQIVTRRTLSPFLIHYAQKNNLTSYDDRCIFDDIWELPQEEQDRLIETCKYRLLRWTQRHFHPDEVITQADILAILMRSKYGFLDEDVQPWYAHYYVQAIDLGVVKSWLDMHIFTEPVTMKDLWLWIYQFEQL